MDASTRISKWTAAGNFFKPGRFFMGSLPQLPSRRRIWLQLEHLGGLKILHSFNRKGEGFMFFFAGCNPLKPEKTSHSIHVWYIYLHLPSKSTIHVNIPFPWILWAWATKTQVSTVFRGRWASFFLGAGKDPKVAHFGPGKLQWARGWWKFQPCLRGEVVSCSAIGGFWQLVIWHGW